MRRSIAGFVLVALLALLLCACGTNGDQPTPGTSTPVAPDASGEQFQIAYLSRGNDAQWPLDVGASIQKLGKEKGFDVTICDAELSAEKQMNQVDEMISKGVDAIILLIVDEGAAEAIATRCREADVVLIGESIPLMDSEGHWVAPQVCLDAYTCGYTCAQWIGENYASLGFDFSDLTQVGFFSIADSRLQNDMNRAEGAEAGIVDAIPGFLEENIFFADIAADAASDALQASFNQVSALISANPQIEYWLTVPVMEDDAIGACRALESAGYADRAIISSIGGERAVLEWPGGQEAPWYAACYFHGMYSAELCVNAALSILNGETTAEEVFPPEAGESYGFTTFNGEMCTFENYTDYVIVLD